MAASLQRFPLFSRGQLVVRVPWQAEKLHSFCRWLQRAANAATHPCGAGIVATHQSDGGSGTARRSVTIPIPVALR